MRPPGRLGAAAAELAARGWAVFPLGQRSKVPLKGSGGFRDATTDPTQIGSWWTQGAYNVGIATGQASGILVVDVDTHGADGRPFIAAHPDLLPPTATVETPTGGQHRYYRLPAGVGAPCTQGDRGGLAPGVDTRGDGGYIVAPPSIHPQGGQYRWAPGASPAERELAVAPPELLARLQPAPPVLTTPAVVSSSSTGASSPLLAPGSRPAPEVLLDWGLRQAQIGSRDNTGFRLARQVLANGYDGGEGEAIMLQYADRVPQTADDPYTHADALRNWESAHRYPILEPWARGGANGVEARATESQVPAAE